MTKRKGPARRPLHQRFWEHVMPAIASNCLFWTASYNAGGYGQIGVGSTADGRRVSLAHRVSYELHNGPIPDGLFVCHTCDMRGCVNPAHLFLGTHDDNMEDAARKGRLKGPFTNASKVECWRGHPFNEENTYHYGGKRNCKACQRHRKCDMRKRRELMRQGC